MKMLELEKCTWEPVIIESPFGNEDPIEVQKNIVYVRAAIRLCKARGLAAYASHALYTLPGILDDRVRDERRRGMLAGFAIGALFRKRIFFTDRGISSGMIEGAVQARELGQEIVSDVVPGWTHNTAAPIDVVTFMDKGGLWEVRR